MPAKKKTKVEKVLHEYKTGTLHSGKGGPVVKSRKQAIAILLSEKKKGKGQWAKGENDSYLKPGMKDEKE
mgnify:CR=1 FL=1